MNRTSIEWVRNPDGTQGYTWNPITGCLNGCDYCYARKLAHGRLKERYLANWNVSPPDLIPYGMKYIAPSHNPFYPRFWPERIPKDRYVTFKQIDRVRENPKGIFVCDMGELFGDWVPEAWQEQVFRVIRFNPWHRFYLLTKQPQNLIKWSPFPPNAWVGVTATNQDMYDAAVYYLNRIEAKIKFISLEPLLHHVHLPNYKDVDWPIIGALTGTKYRLLEISQQWNIQNINQGLTLMPYGNKWTLQPPIEWVEEIVRAADKAGIPVFLKDNLMPLIIDQPRVPSWSSDNKGLRQELPCP